MSAGFTGSMTEKRRFSSSTTSMRLINEFCRNGRASRRSQSLASEGLKKAVTTCEPIAR
jgi:hypothetical protein